MEIKYDSKKNSLHESILTALVERIDLAESEMRDNVTRWQQAEKYYQMYKKQNKKDAKSLVKWEEGDTDFKSVVMPYSYAQLLTAHAYMVNIFLNRDPIFQTDSLNGDGAQKELALESMLQYQVKAGEMEPQLCVWLLDVLRYGLGIVGNFWSEEVYRTTEFVDEEVVIDGVPTGELKEVKKSKTIPGYMGNKLFNVLPYNFLPDPRVAMCNIQDGEFVGRRFELSILDVKKNSLRGDYFNVAQVENLVSKNGDDKLQRHHSVGERDVKGETLTPKGKRIGSVDAVELYIDLVPKDWGLGDSDYPEKWVFIVVGKKYIVYAEPADTLDNKFPYHVLECEVDGYKNKSRGLLEVAAPMNDILTWLFDSHMYNKRQVMNNQFVGDPSAIVMRDVERKDPGKFIRLRPTAYGRDVRTIISQLPVSDVTAQNYQDAQMVERSMQHISGINDDVAGQSAPSSRRSATEFRGTTGFASNRLANMAYHFSVTGIRSLAKSLITTTQQLYDVEMKVKVAGDNIRGAESVTVKPGDIAGQFDLTSVDGTLPVDRMAQAQFWMQVMGMVMNNPVIGSQYRLGDIFSYTARLAGLKGIDKMKMQVLGDEEILALTLAQLESKGTTNGVQPRETATNQRDGSSVGDAQPEATPAQGAAGLSGLSALF